MKIIVLILLALTICAQADSVAKEPFDWEAPMTSALRLSLQSHQIYPPNAQQLELDKQAALAFAYLGSQGDADSYASLTKNPDPLRSAINLRLMRRYLYFGEWKEAQSFAEKVQEPHRQAAFFELAQNALERKQIATARNLAFQMIKDGGERAAMNDKIGWLLARCGEKAAAHRIFARLRVWLDKPATDNSQAARLNRMLLRESLAANLVRAGYLEEGLRTTRDRDREPSIISALYEGNHWNELLKFARAEPEGYSKSLSFSLMALNAAQSGEARAPAIAREGASVALVGAAFYPRGDINKNHDFGAVRMASGVIKALRATSQLERIEPFLDAPVWNWKVGERELAWLESSDAYQLAYYNPKTFTLSEAQKAETEAAKTFLKVVRENPYKTVSALNREARQIALVQAHDAASRQDVELTLEMLETAQFLQQREPNQASDSYWKERGILEIAGIYQQIGKKDRADEFVALWLEDIKSQKRLLNADDIMFGLLFHNLLPQARALVSREMFEKPDHKLADAWGQTEAYLSDKTNEPPFLEWVDHLPYPAQVWAMTAFVDAKLTRLYDPNF